METFLMLCCCLKEDKALTYDNIVDKLNFYIKLKKQYPVKSKSKLIVNYPI